MHQLSLEVIETRDIRISWQVELADGRDKEIGGNDIGGPKLAVLLSR
jgi:hypothetical protein